MYYKLLSKSLTALLVLCSFVANAQQLKSINFTAEEIPQANIALMGKPQIEATKFKVYQFDIESLKGQMAGVMHREKEKSGFIAQVSFPHPDGSFHTYNAKANSTMSDELAAQFPDIKSYDASGEGGAFVKWDITPHGFHAMIMTPGQSTIYIDPIFKGNSDYYIVYSRKDFVSGKIADCQFNSDEIPLKTKKDHPSGVLKAFGTCELRTYRLALSATGEYTAFHGGTVASAQAAQVTTMNRVNGVYERDMAITMNIVGNNNLIIYTNAATDPFTNGNPGTMINQNQANTDAVLGNGSYDIGHVFGTNSGGLAGLGVVCANSQKARGVTGSGAPIGDPFDIDYVAHEMGHQFGGNHTFNNSCGGNRNNATAVEPGSGSTIMAYAGICAPNVQNNSDDHFSGKSLEEIGVEILSAGHTCEATTPLANSAPVILSTNGNVTIPISTPFALTAVATDPDGDPITYNWEQMDNEISTQAPVATSIDGPNFRSNPSLLSPTRYMPDLAGSYPGWEVLPSVTRTMNFRVTIRDNASGAGGCNDHEDITITTDAGSGPFIVNYPSATGITWTGLTSETVTWTVAGTDLAPVACANVDILLSTDGGLTFPTTLASNVPNDGSQVVTVPNISTSTAVIMVICSNGTFFDVSDNNFTITMSTFDYTLTTTPTTVNICQPNDAVYTVDIGSVGGYNDPVTLSVTGVPAGATSSFSTNPVTPVGNSTLTITNTGAAAPGSYTLTVTANSTTGTKTNDVVLIISSGAPSPVTLIIPANGAAGVSLPTSFSWTASPEIGVSYEIDIATDAGFASIVDQATGLAATSFTSTALTSTTTYFWRVRAVTGCGQSAWSTVFTFTTNSCTTYSSTNIPQTISAASVTSTIDITGSGTITDANLTLLDISHAYVGDVSATLTSPLGTVVQLFDGPGIPASQYGCAGDDILASFDDAAALTAADFENMCNAATPTISGDFQSMDPMANFNGESITGTWTLTILDSYTAGDDGVLNAWSLELCTGPPPCIAPDVPTISGAAEVCVGGSTTLSIATGNLNDATDWEWYSGSCGGTPVGTGTPITVSPGGTVTYFVRGEGGCVTPGACASITVTEVGAPSDVTQISPADAATGVAIPTTFTWTTAPETGVTYEIDIATDLAFTAIVDQATGLATATYVSSILTPSQTYYWRVRAVSPCGIGNWSSAFSFTTTSCIVYPSTVVPVTISTGAPASVTSTVTVPTNGVITDVNVLDLIGNHTRISDLTITLSSPLGTVVTLFDQVCANQNDFNLSLDDAAAPGPLPCPPVGGGTYQPNTVLSAFNGEDPAGTWTLTITDVQNLQGGALTGWSLEICADPAVACTNPDVPTIAGTATICPGTSTTLSISSGNLNDATDWQWYTGSCGGTAIGSGTSIAVSPGAVTTYFVRGEGGCVVPGACAQFTVTPQDAIAPVVTCPGNQTETFDASCQFTLPDYTGLGSATDNCDPTPVITQSPLAGTVITGTTTVTLTATDASGNAATCSFNVIATDATAPSIVCPGNQMAFVDAACSAVLGDYISITTASDACDAAPVITQSPAPGTPMGGITTVTMTATDASGNASTCNFTVTPMDTTAPTVVCPGNQVETFDASCQFTLPDYTGLTSASDNCDPAPLVSQSPAPGSVITGTTTITMTVVDALGNSSTCSFDVVANDATPPVITCPGNQTLFADASCQGTLPDYTGLATATDNCGTPTVTQSPAAGTVISGTTTITLTATDGINTTTCAFTVSLIDNTAPVIVCPGNQTVIADASCQGVLADYTGLATATDNCGAPTITQSPSAGTTISGATTVTLTATDGTNTSTCTFTVFIIDNTAPTVVCPGNQTETFDAACQLILPDYTALATATDNCDAAPSLTQFPAPGSVITGTTTITITAMDSQGNSSTCTFDVIANDITPPTIACPGNQTVTANAACQGVLADYTALASATDNCGTPAVTQSPSAGTTISGTTTVTLTATDGMNTSTCTFTVSITDNTAPTIACPADQSGCVSTLPDYTSMVTVSDACDASPTITQSPAAGSAVSGTVIITMTATDVAGNSSTCSFSLTAGAGTTTNQSATICDGNSYTFPDGTTGTTTQVYTSVLTGAGGCDSTIVTSLTVLQASVSTEDIEICEGGSYTFPDGVIGTTTQAHTSVLTGSNGCDSIIVTALTVHPAYNTTVDAVICTGEVYTFPDGTTGSTAQTQTSSFTTVNGCDSTIMTNLIVETVDASVTQAGKILTATQTGATYQWIDCDNGNSPIAGATNQSFIPSATTGNYAVIVTVGNCSDTSACQLVDLTALGDIWLDLISIYPNPATDIVTVEWDGEVNMIEITDAQGKLVKRVNEFTDNSYQFEIQEFSPGVYFIHIESEYGRTVHDLMKQ